MRDNRVKGQSQLDYLWSTFGSYVVSSNITKDKDYSIPTESLVNKLIEESVSNPSLKLSIKGNYLILHNDKYEEISKVDMSVFKGVSVIEFSQKIISDEDINSGCNLDLGTNVYYLELTDGSKFWVESISGGESNSINTKVINNKIISDLKIDSNQGNVILSLDNGLRAFLPIKNLNSPVQFEFLRQSQYDKIAHDQSTLYFIKNQPYFYFGDQQIGQPSNIFEVVEILPSNGDPNKIYFVKIEEGRYSTYVFINNVPILIGSTQHSFEDIILRLDNLEARVDNLDTLNSWNNIQ